MKRSVWAAVALAGALTAAEMPSGPLVIHPENPRYFADGDGKVVYLTGSHTWNTIVDMSPSDPPAKFDFDAFLDWVEGYGHNFIRLWTWELTEWNTAGNNPKNRGRLQQHFVAPLAWARTGPGKALDGKPKFDLTKYDPKYFKRLRTRVRKAGERGFYVSVMLFEGWGLQRVPNGFESHPMHPDNNVNGINGDANRDGLGVEVHTLAQREVTRIQEAYVKKVLDELNDFDHVMYEISNENHGESTAWQYHMIEFIKQYEKRKKKQHLVGMTFQFKGGTNQNLFESPADWISPNREGGYRDDPPPADGSKIILSDTDHLWGIGGNADWVWKTFVRGMHPLFMDPYDGAVLGTPNDTRFEPVRRAMGYTLSLARRVRLEKMMPRGDLASSEYCLADPASEYIVFLPGGGQVTVDLTGAKGTLAVEWINATSGRVNKAGYASGGRWQSFTAPSGGSAVLHLKVQ